MLRFSKHGGTPIGCASKTIDDDLKASLNNNGIGVTPSFQSFLEKRGKTVTLRFGDVIIDMIISALKSLQTISLLGTNRRRRNSRTFLLNKFS